MADLGYLNMFAQDIQKMASFYADLFRLEEIREPRAPESACALNPRAFEKYRDHIPLFLYVRASKS